MYPLGGFGCYSNMSAYGSCMSAPICICGLHASMHACVQTVMIAPSENRCFGFFFIPYLTTNTSRRVNYSAQQTSCFWQSGPGSEHLLLLCLCLLLDHKGGGTSQNEECEPNFTFPIFDCSLNKWVKGRQGERHASLLRRPLLFFSFEHMYGNRDNKKHHEGWGKPESIMTTS